MIRLWFALLLLIPIAAQAAGFTPEQRAEIVAIVRNALKADPSILRDALSALQTDESLRQEAAARAAIASAGSKLTGNPADPVAGNPSGDVTVVEFYDPRCPYCRQMMPVIANLLASDHGIRLVYKDIPVLGPASVLESRALLAAQRQGGYLKLQQNLMQSSADPTEAAIQAIAEKLGLDGARLAHDMNDPAIAARLDSNIQLAQSLGVEGTPAIVIGQKMIAGAVDLAALQQAVTTARQH